MHRVLASARRMPLSLMSSSALRLPSASLVRGLPLRVAATSLSSGIRILPFEKRVFSTSLPVRSEVKEEAVAPTQEGGLLDRGYQWYPVIGLGLTAAVTQEFLIFDEYWITGGALATVMYAAYVLGMEQMQAAVKDGYVRRVAQTKAAFGIRLDNLKRWQALEEFSLSHAEELRNLYAEEERINQLAVDYQNIRHKVDTRNAILSKLNSIKVLEDDARLNAVSALSRKAVEYVEQSYRNAPAAVKSKHVDAAIGQIVPELSTKSIATARANPQPLASDDPVKLLFDEFLAQPRTYKELGVSTGVEEWIARKSGSAH